MLMKITIGSGHAGFALKKVLVEHLQKSGHQLTNVGTDSTAPVDYPDYAEAVALGEDLCTIFLNAQFTGEERHRRRPVIVLDIEQRYPIDSVAKEKIS